MRGIALSNLQHVNLADQATNATTLQNLNFFKDGSQTGVAYVNSSGVLNIGQQANFHSPANASTTTGRIVINSSGVFYFRVGTGDTLSSVYAATFVGALQGNATTATTATTANNALKVNGKEESALRVAYAEAANTATTATTASNANRLGGKAPSYYINTDNIGSQTVTKANLASRVEGTYSGRGGAQPPSWVGILNTKFIMSSGMITGNSDFKDIMVMNNYNGSDVPYVTGVAVTKTASPRGYIMSAPKDATTTSSWVSAEIITSANIASQTVNKAKTADTATSATSATSATKWGTYNVWVGASGSAGSDASTIYFLY